MKRLLVTALLLSPASAFAWGRAGAPDWLKAIAKTSLPAYRSDTRAVVLLDETVTTVNDANDIRTMHRIVYRVLTTAGRDVAVQGVAYDDQTKITSLNAWGINAAGEEFAAGKSEIYETSMTNDFLYSDEKVRAVKIPSAEPGSVVAAEYEQRSRPFVLQDAWQFQRDIPVRVARYTLILPAGWHHEEHWFQAAAVTPQTSGNSTTWELHDVGEVRPERGRPPFRAVAGRMAINFLPPQPGLTATHRTWNDVGVWQTQLASGRLNPTPELQAKVRQLVDGKTDTLDRIRTLARFAQRDIRYVAIEIGIGGWQPHPAADIFTNRYGDCKDKATLLATMLHEIGVDAYYVAVSTDRGVVDHDFATAANFNHMVLAIRIPDSVNDPSLNVIRHPRLGKLLIFDPTFETLPFGQVPTYLQENVGLLITGTGGELIDIPLQPAATSRLTRTAKLTLDDAGALTGTVTEVYTGGLAAEVRLSLQAANDADRVKFVETHAAWSVPQVTVRDVAIENTDDVAKDLVIRFSVSVPRYAQHAAGLILVPPRLMGEKGERVVDLKERVYGYQTEGPTLQTDEIDIALPAGIRLDELPPAVHASAPGATYQATSKFEANTLRYRREYKVDRFTISRAELPELNRLFTEIRADERSSAVFRE